jgi:hypothetical protein
VAKKTKNGQKFQCMNIIFSGFFGQGLLPALTNLWTPHKNSTTFVKQDTIGTVFTQKIFPQSELFLWNGKFF